MSHFYTSTENSRGNPVTASGTKRGQVTHTRGWNSGVKTISKINPLTGADEFHIYATSGSNGGAADKFLGVVTSEGFKPVTES